MDVVTLGMAKADAAKRHGHRNPNRIVWFGDSLTEQGGLVTTPQVTYPVSFWPWAAQYLGHRIVTAKMAGVGGNTTTQMIARMQADVMTQDAGWVHVLAGSNDVAQAVPVSTILTNLRTIYDACTTAGFRLIIGTIPPRSTYTGTMKADLETLNGWIRDQGRLRANVLVVDYNSMLTAIGTSNDGVYRADATSDGVHLSPTGAERCGRLLANTLAPFVNGAPDLPISDSDAHNLINNGRFVNGGDGVTALAYWGQSFTTAPTLSKAARTDDIAGNWQVLTCVNGVSGILTNNASVGPRLAIGDQAVATIEYDVSNLDAAAAAKQRGFGLALKAYNGTTFTDTTWDFYWVKDSSENMPALSRKGVFRTPPLTVPAGTSLIQMSLLIGGGGTYKVDRAAVWNLTKGRAL